MTDDDYQEAPPRPRKNAGGSTHSQTRRPNAAAPKQKRAPASKSPQRPKKTPTKKGAPGTIRAKSPARPSPSSNHGPRKPIAKGKPKTRVAANGNGIPKGSGRAIPKGSNRSGGKKEQAPASVKSRSSSDDELSPDDESSDDEFDEEGLSSGVPPASSHSAARGRSDHSRGGNSSTRSNRSGATIRDRARGATIRNNPAFRSDHSRGTTRSNHSGGSNNANDEGAIVPFGESEAFESFHGDGQDYEDDAYNGAIVPVANNGQYDDETYDTRKLKPPPKIKMSKEDSERGEFPHDAWYQKCLRYFRILSPHPQEDDLRKQVRYLIWSTLVLDVLVAVVSIATFGDGVTSCCGTAVMAAGLPGIDWNIFMKVITWIYLIGIFLEIHPVVREGPIPWNLLNPSFGFLISFAVFVDDSKTEAISIWILELGSVILELITYRKLRNLHNRKLQRLEDLEAEIANEKYSLGYRKTAYLRERRETRLFVSGSEKNLRYHFGGSAVNAGLVSITLLLIIVVARGGGLCLVGGAGGGLDIFNSDQQSRCNKCGDVNGFGDRCIICKFPGTENEEPDQCYFPYF
ncbi:MAG: hypothetical protein SGBAC_006415 [Bacillariaceae sp.]